MTVTPDAPVTATAPPVSSRPVIVRLLRDPQGALCLLWLAFVGFLAVSAPWLAPTSPTATDLAATNAPPFTPGHPLGGDSSGRDILSRLMWGSRETVVACVIVLVVSVAVGVTSGLAAGFYRGRFEAGAGFLSDLVMSLPGIVLLIALYARTGPNIPVAMAVFGLLIAPSFYRLVRSIVLSVRNELYVDAARVVGLSDLRIVGRHVLWAVRAPVIIASSGILAAGIGIQAGVAFLGLGDPAGASWGTVLQSAFEGIYQEPRRRVMAGADHQHHHSGSHPSGELSQRRAAGFGAQQDALVAPAPRRAGRGRPGAASAAGGRFHRGRQLRRRPALGARASHRLPSRRWRDPRGGSRRRPRRPPW
jgi:peptide/nickel transport system permease protein